MGESNRHHFLCKTFDGLKTDLTGAETIDKGLFEPFVHVRVTEREPHENFLGYNIMHIIVITHDFLNESIVIIKIGQLIVIEELIPVLLD